MSAGGPSARRLACCALFFLGCAAPHAGQGGARFLEHQSGTPQVPVEAMYPVCFERGATGSVTLQFQPGGQVFFEVEGGASNSTGRCLREIASTYPHAAPPSGAQVVKAGAPATGWAWLAWVKLLSSTRFGPERGLLDPAPLVAACLGKGMGLRQGATFEVEPAPAHQVRVLANDGHPGAFTDTERCIEAVLGSTVWPSSRPASFRLEGSAGAPSAAADALPYFHTGPLGTALDATAVHDAFALAQPAVSACWEAALARRPALGGGRTVRLRVDARGLPDEITIAGNASQSPLTAADYLLDQCLVAAVKGSVRLPGAGPGETAYSWVFATRG